MKQESLGQIFKRYRETEKIKIEKVETDIRISQRIIRALENDDYTILPDELYIRKIIKKYAEYLSLDYNRLLNLFEEEKKDKITQKQKAHKPIRVFLTPKIIRNLAILIISLSLFIYLGLQVKKIFEPPYLIVSQPEINQKITENYIEIRGNTENEARVFINEKEVFISPQGEFKQVLDLQKGVNYIKISAIKKHSRENVIFREILVE